jgi:FlaA1/EpsC-like NDP-sugar epimerase
LRTDPAATRRVLGRPDKQYFQHDCTATSRQLHENLHGRRILVLGGAGSIGSVTVGLLADLAPRALHVVDTDENGLAELVRDLRSRRAGLLVPDFRAVPLDFGSPLMRRFLGQQERYDFVLNFAAVKHVRSEKDVHSLLHLLDTNVVKVDRLLRWLVQQRLATRFFTVSTDKAANPVSLMGASKRVMEDVAFLAARSGLSVSSTRFANVAFSNGSLLSSFVNRLAKMQPLVAPRDTRRFFVTLEEAGRLCLLAAAGCPPGYLLVPGAEFRALDQRLEDIAIRFLQMQALEARLYDQEDAAREAVARDHALGRYPVLLTPRDTSGEKAYEEFVAADEETVPLGFLEIEGVRHQAASTPERLRTFVSEIERYVVDPERPVDKGELIALFQDVVPHLGHVETGRTLDQRM